MLVNHFLPGKPWVPGRALVRLGEGVIQMTWLPARRLSQELEAVAPAAWRREQQSGKPEQGGLSAVNKGNT